MMMLCFNQAYSMSFLSLFRCFCYYCCYVFAKNLFYYLDRFSFFSLCYFLFFSSCLICNETMVIADRFNPVELSFCFLSFVMRFLLQIVYNSLDHSFSVVHTIHKAQCIDYTYVYIYLYVYMYLYI